MPSEAEPAATSASRSAKGARPPTRATLVVACAVVAVAAAACPAQPTGVRVADAAWSAFFSVGLVLAAARSRRVPTLWLLGVAAAVALPGGWTGALLAGLALLVGVLIVRSDRHDLRLGGAAGAVASQAFLWAPPYGPFGLQTLLAAVAVVPVVVSAWRVMGRKSRRRTVRVSATAAVLLAAVTGIATSAVLRARPAVTGAVRQTELALDLVADRKSEAAAEQFRDAGRSFTSAHNAVADPIVGASQYLPLIGPHVRALRELTGSGAAVSTAAATTAAKVDWTTLTLTNGRLDPAALQPLAAPVAESRTAVSRAVKVLRSVRSPWLLPPLARRLDQLDTRMQSAASQATTVDKGLDAAPDLLGTSGPKRYLLTLGSPSEARNGGGFVGAFGVLTVDDGRLSLGPTYPIRQMTPESGTPGLRYPPDWSARYGSYNVTSFPGNLSASPSWPFDASVAEQLFSRAPEGQPVDGVMYADPAAIAGLLRLTGPVRVPSIGRTFSAADVELFLYVGQYAQFPEDQAERKEVLGDVARSAFDALTSRTLPNLESVARVVGPLVAEGHLRLTMVDENTAAQEFLDSAGASGQWAVPSGSDVISVRSANLFANKLDTFLRRDVDVAVESDSRTGAVRSTVSVTLRNTVDPAVWPAYVTANTQGLPAGTNRDLLAVYSHLRLDDVTVDGRSAARASQEELGARVYSTSVDIPPGGTVRVVWKFSGSVRPRQPYRLTVLPQPLATPDTAEVTITQNQRPELVFRGEVTRTLHLSADSRN